METLLWIVVGLAWLWVIMRHGGCCGAMNHRRHADSPQTAKAQDANHVTGHHHACAASTPYDRRHHHSAGERDLWSGRLAGKGAPSSSQAASASANDHAAETVRQPSSALPVAVTQPSIADADWRLQTRGNPASYTRETDRKLVGVAAASVAGPRNDLHYRARAAGLYTHTGSDGDLREAKPEILGPLTGRPPTGTVDHSQAQWPPVRSGQWVTDLVEGMLLTGMSLARVREIVAPLLHTTAAASDVSGGGTAFHQSAHAWHRRPLWDEYQYLLLDSVRVSLPGVVEADEWAALCAYGVTHGNRREWLDYRFTELECPGQWVSLLDDLRHRGLGNHVEMAVVDGEPGLHAALRLVFPSAQIQQCWAHKLRRVASHLDEAHRAHCVKEAALIYESDSQREAFQRCRLWMTEWQIVAPKAVACLESDLGSLFRFFEQPRKHWRQIRTTNAIERQFRELRGPDRALPRFAREESADLILYAVFNHANSHQARHR